MQRWSRKDRKGMDLTEAEDIKKRWQEYTDQIRSVTQSCPNLLRPHESQHASPPCPSPTPGVHSNMSIESVMPSSHLILCRPLLLLPPVPPSITVFSNESTLRMRWPKYWSFSFSISPSNEHPGPISFRMDSLEKAMAPHSSTLAWKIPWMEEPGRLQSMGSRRVRLD